MDRVTWIRQRPDDVPRTGVRRERTSIDLRGPGPALIAIAQSKHMSVASLVRTILSDWLESRSAIDAGCGVAGLAGVEVDASNPDPKLEASVKVTLRLPAGYAVRLARAARAAELSQGRYVVRLLDAWPSVPEVAEVPEQRECRRVLLRSTATLAAMSSDLQALTRVLRQSALAEQAACNATVAQLSDAVRQHLAAAAPLMAALMPSRRPPASHPV